MWAGSETVARTSGGYRRALAVHPRELMIVDRAGAVKPKDVRRHGNVCLVPPGVSGGWGDHFGIAPEFECLLIERLRHERMVMDEQHATGTAAENRSIQRARLRAHQRFGGRDVKRSDADG